MNPYREPFTIPRRKLFLDEGTIIGIIIAAALLTGFCFGGAIFSEYPPKAPRPQGPQGSYILVSGGASGDPHWVPLEPCR